VLAVAVEGEVHGGFTLAEDAVMLLGQSAQGTYVFHGLRAADWVKVLKALSASPKAVRMAIDWAERIVGRLARKGAVAPSPPQARLTGTEGTIAAWAATLSANMAADGSLFGSLAEGGLGVRPELFRASGYLTDFGGLPPAEYQA
jgi:hypothetical protein